MFQNGQKVVVVSSGDPARVVKVQAASSLDTGRYPTVDTTGVTGRDQQVQIVSGGDETRFPKLQGLADARSTADSVITALSPAAWYRNATDVVSSGGFASIWADYASTAQGLVLPGVAGNNASTPDAAALDISDDVDILVRVALSDYSPAGQQDFVNKGSAYGLYIKAGATALTFLISGIAEYNSTAAPTVTDGTAYWLRVTRVRSTGKINFYQAADSATVPSSWTQVGAEVSGSTSAMPNSAIALSVGGTSATTGTVFRAIVKSGVGGTTVFDADFSAQAIGAGSFTESSSNAATVTINTSGARPAHIGKARDLLQGTGTNQPAYAAGVFTFDGADNFMATSATTINQPLTMVLAVKQITWTLNDALVDGGASFQVYIFQNAATPALRAGAGSDIAANTNLAVGSRGIFCAVINGASSSTRVNNTAKVTGAAGAGNFSAVRLGAAGGGTASSSNIAVEEFIIFPSALSDANQDAVITALNNALTVF